MTVKTANIEKFLQEGGGGNIRLWRKSTERNQSVAAGEEMDLVAKGELEKLLRKQKQRQCML